MTFRTPATLLMLACTFAVPAAASSGSAKTMYERVLDEYPDSPEAELARKALDAAPMREPEPTPQLTGNSLSY